MIRTLLRPTTFTRAAPRTVLAGRSVTTRAPTNSSGSPTTEISGTLAPGEEVDPQRTSLFPVLSTTYRSVRKHNMPFVTGNRSEESEHNEVLRKYG